MSAAGTAYDLLSKDERLALLGTLGFLEPPRYREWEEKDLSYGCLHYEVQDELDRCFARGEWKTPETPVKQIMNGPKCTPRRRKRRLKAGRVKNA